ncbi:MAG: hypothetical protein A2091_00550 [Desulfuromonadales bacterium GWD2_61_12]|nr:MAG: hypothetical protein A2005_06885 [Desulfuromonadales bacterium GWC2_61_20]OGR34792.1 MAG: hypothetical protein A2091_00550 [Desulfuromonadales bacterium GWD2_61_12]
MKKLQSFRSDTAKKNFVLQPSHFLQTLYNTTFIEVKAVSCKNVDIQDQAKPGSAVWLRQLNSPNNIDRVIVPWHRQSFLMHVAVEWQLQTTRRHRRRLDIILETYLIHRQLNAIDKTQSDTIDFSRLRHFAIALPVMQAFTHEFGPITVRLKTAENVAITIKLNYLLLIFILEAKSLQTQILKVLLRRHAYAHAKLLAKFAWCIQKMITGQSWFDGGTQGFFIEGRCRHGTNVDDTFDNWSFWQVGELFRCIDYDSIHQAPRD